MFNVRFGGGKPSGASPFVSGGAGLMRASVTSPGDLFDEVTRNDFALNVGGGLNGYFNDHVGLRGDIRYFRSLQGETAPTASSSTRATSISATSTSGARRSACSVLAC